VWEPHDRSRVTTYAAPCEDALGESRGDGSRPNANVLVIFEAGRGGEAALNAAAVLADAGADLWVVTLAPQARPYKCCGGGGAGPYNCAIRGEAEDDLRQARNLLGSAAASARFTTLTGTPQPPLGAWASEHAFDLILLPKHRLTRELRRATAAEVRPVR
jgi:hypothetical protein